MPPRVVGPGLVRLHVHLLGLQPPVRPARGLPNGCRLADPESAARAQAAAREESEAAERQLREELLANGWRVCGGTSGISEAFR